MIAEADPSLGENQSGKMEQKMEVDLCWFDSWVSGHPPVYWK